MAHLHTSQIIVFFCIIHLFQIHQANSYHPIHLFIYSFINLIIYLIIHLFIYSFIDLLIYSFIHLFIFFFYWFIYPFICNFMVSKIFSYQHKKKIIFFVLFCIYAVIFKSVYFLYKFLRIL